MDEKIIEQAKNASSAEELLALAKEMDLALTEDKAAELFDALHRSGELEDSELDGVAGGGCSGDFVHTLLTSVEINGTFYTIVSSGLSCFTGKYEKGYRVFYNEHNIQIGTEIIRQDNKSLRETWAFCSGPCAEVCGDCLHLEFKGGFGYCGVEWDR